MKAEYPTRQEVAIDETFPPEVRRRVYSVDRLPESKLLGCKHRLADIRDADADGIKAFHKLHKAEERVLKEIRRYLKSGGTSSVIRKMLKEEDEKALAFLEQLLSTPD